jgi:Ca2+-binding EF-hand superfamily protein
MRTKSKLIMIILLFAVLFTTGPFAQNRAAAPARQDGQGLKEDEVNLLFFLMDTNKNGKISKQEWMTFMSAEFDRLDTDKSGDLDPKELAKLSLRRSNFSYTGK